MPKSKAMPQLEFYHQAAQKWVGELARELVIEKDDYQSAKESHVYIRHPRCAISICETHGLGEDRSYKLVVEYPSINKDGVFVTMLCEDWAQAFKAFKFACEVLDDVREAVAEVL